MRYEKCDRDRIFKKGNIMLRLLGGTLTRDSSRGGIMTLLVYWNNIDENYQVLIVEGDSYDFVCGLKYNMILQVT